MASASSATSMASVTASVAASSASKSISSASTKASAALQDASSIVSPSASSASAAASATASKLAARADEGLSGFSQISIVIAVIVTLLAVVAAGVYFSGYADDVMTWVTKKYYVGKAQAEVAALKNVASEKVEGLLKDSLKNNPAMGEAELEQVAPGLGAEAAQEGLAGVSEKLGGMGSEVVQGGVAGVSEKLGGLGKL